MWFECVEPRGMLLVPLCTLKLAKITFDLQDWKARGKFLNGGAFTDPCDGAILVFQDSTKAEVEEYARTDPCTLVKPLRIRCIRCIRF